MGLADFGSVKKLSLEKAPFLGGQFFILAIRGFLGISWI